MSRQTRSQNDFLYIYNKVDKQIFLQLDMDKFLPVCILSFSLHVEETNTLFSLIGITTFVNADFMVILRIYQVQTVT